MSSMKKNEAGKGEGESEGGVSIGHQALLPRVVNTGFSEEMALDQRSE